MKDNSRTVLRQNRTNFPQHTLKRGDFMTKFDRSRYPDEPNSVFTTSCGARAEVYWPRDRTLEDCRKNLEKAANELVASLYRDIRTGKRTWQEMVALIREHDPDYEPKMVPRSEIFGE